MLLVLKPILSRLALVGAVSLVLLVAASAVDVLGFIPQPSDAAQEQELAVIPTEEQAGERLRELHRAWRGAKAGGRTVKSVCDEFDWFPASCEEYVGWIGLGELPDSPPTWTATFEHVHDNPYQPQGRMLQVVCWEPGTGKPGVNNTLFYYGPDGVLDIRSVNYWRCYDALELDRNGYASVPMDDKPVVFPRERQAGNMLAELHRLWGEVKAGKRTARSVCRAVAWMPGECMRSYREAGLNDLPAEPPTWSNTWLHKDIWEQPEGRILEVSCRDPGTGEPGKNRVLAYTAAKRTLRVHHTSYWRCYRLNDYKITDGGTAP